MKRKPAAIIAALLIVVIGVIEVAMATRFTYGGQTKYFYSLYTGVWQFIVGSKPYTSAYLAGFIWLILAVVVFFIVSKIKVESTKANTAGNIGIGNTKMATTSQQVYISHNKRIQELQQTGENLTDMIEAKLFAISFQESLLRAPASAQFPPIDEIFCTLENNIYTVTGYVDSQNAYGAMVRTPFSYKVTKINGLWQSFAAKPLTVKTVGFAFVGSAIILDIIAIPIFDIDLLTPILVISSILFVVGLVMIITGRR